MTTLPNLDKTVTKDPAPPAFDTIVSPITIPNGTILVTTKTTNETIDNVNQIIDYISGDNGPNFIPQSAIDSLTSDLAGKEPTLGFTPENLANKVTIISTPGNDTNYPTEKAVRDQLDLKEDSANKGASNGYAALDSSSLLLLANFTTGTALQILRRNAANTALEFVDQQVASGVFLDSIFRIQGSVDQTKQLAFEVDGFSTGVTRTITVPNVTSTMAVLDAVTQSWTGNNFFVGPVTVEDDKFSIHHSFDTSKRVEFNASQISGGQTRIITIPDISTTMAGLGVTLQIWTGENIFQGETTVRGFTIQDPAAPTKELEFNLSQISPSTLRTITVPDVSFTLAGLEVDQDWTGINVFEGPTFVFDADFLIRDTIDTTKRLQFNLNTLPTGVISTLIPPNGDGTIVITPMVQDLDGGNNKIINVTDPTNPQDVVTRAFGDANYLNASALNDLSDVDTTGEAVGSTLFKSAGDWIILTAGSTGQVLTIAAGIPSWAAPTNSEFFGPWTNTHDAGGQQLVMLGSLSSNSPNPATLGLVRLAVTDTIEWRNVANLDNNQISFSGDVFEILHDGIAEYSFSATELDMHDNGLKDVSAIFDSNDNIILDLVGVLNGFSHIRITNSISGLGPIISTHGSANDVDLKLQTQGSGVIFITSNSISLGETNTVNLDLANQTSPVGLTLPNLAGVDDILVVEDFTQTLLNKTLTDPIINKIIDANGNTLLDFIGVPIAVNNIRITNSIEDLHPIISVVGDDAGIALELAPKGNAPTIIMSNTIDFGKTNPLLIVNTQTTSGSFLFIPDIPTSDSFVTLLNTQTLENKTLITPVIEQINDANGNVLLDFEVIASAVNHFTIRNAASGDDPIISVEGLATNIDLQIVAKGPQGSIVIGSDNVIIGKVNPVSLGFSIQGAPVTIDLPNLNGNDDVWVVLDLAQTLLNKTLTTPTIGNFTNSQHNHQNAAGGGVLSSAALSDVADFAKINQTNSWGAFDQNIATGGKFQEAGVDISPIGKHDIWFDAGGIIPVDSGVVTTRIVGTGVQQKSFTFIPFATSVDTFAVVKFKLPRNYNNGNLTAVFNWTSETEGSGDVVWEIAGVALSDGQSIGGISYGSGEGALDTQLTINISQDSSRTSPFTLGNTPVDGDTIYLKITRLGTDVNDTFGEDAQLLGISIELITDAAVSP